MSKFLSSRLSSLVSYTPGEQISGGDNPALPKYTKLNTNESPYPPSPGVFSALAGSGNEINRLNLYPDPDGKLLVSKIAGSYDVKPENVIIGNGSDELLAFSFIAFFDNAVAFPDITYGFYPVYAGLFGAPYLEIPLRGDLTVCADDYINIQKNVVLANPNAPTGICLAPEHIEAIAGSNPNHLVLIDEAYVDFGAESAIPLTKKYENLLILHTYSKARSLAGGRLAYAIGAKPLIDDLNKIKYSFNPYNVNRLTQAAGLAALNDNAYYIGKQQEIIKTREYSARQLRKLGFELTDSKANFLFAKNPCISGEALYLKLKEKYILVRHWNKPRISNYIRITVGTMQQMDSLFTAIKEIIS